MTIQLSDAGKRFNRDWIFRHVNFTFEHCKSYAIKGSNGSGKSTLLQAIASSMNVSEGTIIYSSNDSQIQEGNFYQYISIAAPYVELIEEMTAKELLAFHSSFKPLLSHVSIDGIIKTIGLEKAADKQIRYYSSGMKQRVKLAQAIFSDAPVLLLDEPCTNLDSNGYALYHELINDYCHNKLIIVSSNDKNEIDFCKEQISIMDYK
jgi:ABC-type multidrug transport system ATPase subunit